MTCLSNCVTMDDRLPRKYLFTTLRVAIITWALTAAIALNLVMPVYWWHPYCGAQTDGPGYNAIGLPLPFSIPTGAGSLEYFLMPHAYIFDTLVLATLAWPLMRRLATLWQTTAITKSLAVAGSIALLLVIGVQSLIFSVGSRTVMTFPSYSDSDGYIDYRPTFLVNKDQTKRCYF